MVTQLVVQVRRMIGHHGLVSNGCQLEVDPLPYGNTSAEQM